MNTTKIALLLHTAIAAQLMLASATSHFVVNLNWPVVQKVTSELLSRLTNVVQLLDVSNVHQKQQQTTKQQQGTNEQPEKEGKAKEKEKAR